MKLYFLEAVCKPPCANGGACVAPNYCACTARWGGPRCETGWWLCMKEVKFESFLVTRSSHPTLMQLPVDLAARIVEYVSIIHVIVLLVGMELSVGMVCICGMLYVWCLCMYICMYVCMHACMYACMYVCIYVCMYVCNVRMCLQDVIFISFSSHLFAQRMCEWRALYTPWPLCLPHRVGGSKMRRG